MSGVASEWSVSVVIPTHNRASLISETLDSILSQSLPPNEIIVVDDGSTDDTEAVVRRCSASIRYIRQPQAGVCRARNAGAAAAQSRWLSFCDSDDLWKPEKLEAQTAIHRARPDIEFSFINFRIVQDGTWQQTTKFDAAPEWFWRDWLRPDDCAMVAETPVYASVVQFQPIFQSNIMLTRTLFQRVGGYDEAMTGVRSEDFEFTLRCVQYAPIAAVVPPLVGVRKHASNFSGSALQNLLGELFILRHALQHHPFARTCSDIVQQEISYRSALAVEDAFREGRLDLVRELAPSVTERYSSSRFRLKAAVASLPDPAAHRLARGVVRMLDWLRARYPDRARN